MRDNKYDEYIMGIALGLAVEAAEADEVPVGAVIVKDGNIIATGRNMRETSRLSTAHAEIEAINEACRKLGGWNLHDCDLYVTLEPCPMCAGAIINSRIANVIIGATDPKSGALGGKFDMTKLGLNHKPEIHDGVMAEQCASILTAFFKNKRERGARWNTTENTSE